MYYAVKFDAKTRERLLDIAESICPIPDDWKIYCDHITICHSSHKDWEKWNKCLKEILGLKIPFRIKGYGKDNYVVALAVEDINTANSVSHITIACASGAKPVQSNYIRDWNGLDQSKFPCFFGEIELCQ